jgi:large subunit ribosomal protein L21
LWSARLVNQAPVLVGRAGGASCRQSGRLDAVFSQWMTPGEMAPGKESAFVYAIVRCGGRQEKASVDDVLIVDKLAGEVGSTVTLPALLIVDDGKVISDKAELGRCEVTAEILGPAVGPKIHMIHYKNKTGYRRRQGHRQKYTQVKVTGIGAGKASASAGKKA